MRIRQTRSLMLCAAAFLILAGPPALAGTGGQVAAPNTDQMVPQASKPVTAQQPAAAPEQTPTRSSTSANPKDWNANVRVEVTITDTLRPGTAVRKSIGVTVRNGGKGSVRSGMSMQTPSTTFVPMAQGGAAASPMTSYQYKDMGLSLDVTSAHIQDNFVTLRIAVEYNPVDEKTATLEGANAPPPGQGMASFAQFRQNLDVVLESGKPLLVAASSDPVPSRDRTTSLEVKATILR